MIPVCYAPQNEILTIFIQVKVVLITELLRSTGKEYIIFCKEVLKTSDLWRQRSYWEHWTDREGHL